MDNSRAVVVGAIAAIALTPVLHYVWRRLAPPSKCEGVSEAARANGAQLSFEALAVYFLLVGTWAAIRGFGTEVAGLEVAIAVCGALAVPYWWVRIRAKISDRGSLIDYATYFESTHGVSFKSVSTVSMVATVLAGTLAAIEVFS